MADAQKTEKPTKRRMEKARREGQFAVSREMVNAVQFMAFVVALFALGGRYVGVVSQFFRESLAAAFRVQLDVRAVVRLYYIVLRDVLFPLFVFAVSLTGALLAIQLATTKLGIAPSKLAPDLKRLNPITKLTQLPRQNVSALTQALLLLPLVGLTLYAIGRRSVTTLVQLPMYAIRPAAAVVAQSIHELLWRFAWLLVALGCLDFIRQAHAFNANLRMTKQEIREEMKETDGNPQIKGRVRRIQRDLARRNMMKEVAKATAVVVNPTHYSVALRYDVESMSAPRVVAKGKNYLALRIRQIAVENQVPIVENQPLAQALYKSADVGQEIPAHLYRAVAEILAYIYKLMHSRTR